MTPAVQLTPFGAVAQILEPALKGLRILQVQPRNEILPLRMLAAERAFPANSSRTCMGFSSYHLCTARSRAGWHRSASTHNLTTSLPRPVCKLVCS